MCLPWRLNSLACACVICFFFFVICFSLRLCRLAKPPVPKPHLWSPGKWLIWKYNHSGQDFVFYLAETLSLLAQSISSHSPPTAFPSSICLPLLFFFLSLHVSLQNRPFLPNVSAVYQTLPYMVHGSSISSSTERSIWRDKSLLSSNLTYWEKDRSEL